MENMNDIWLQLLNGLYDFAIIRDNVTFYTFSYINPDIN